MPRRKRTRIRDEGDGAFPSKRRHTENSETLVISDSETEVEEYKPTTRESRIRGRESRAPARELTEEEELELAVRLSEKEAGNAALRRQQQEEEDMRLAIAQSLHSNGMQTTSDACELLPLVMTVAGLQPSADQRPAPASESHAPAAENHTPAAVSHTPAAENHAPAAESHTPVTESHAPVTESHAPVTESHAPAAESHAPVTESHTSTAESHTPVAESPAFPSRQKPAFLSLSKRKRGDQIPTATAVGVAQSRKLSEQLSQPADLSEAPPLRTDAPVPALPASEEVVLSQGRPLGSDSDWESQESAPGRAQGAGSPVFARSPSQKPVLHIAKLSPSLEQDRRAAGFVRCSQNDPDDPEPPPAPRRSPEPPPSPVFPSSRAGGGARGPGAGRKVPEATASAEDEASESLLPRHTGPSPSSHCAPERAPASGLQPANQTEGRSEDASGDRAGSDPERGEDRPGPAGACVGRASDQSAHGVSESIIGVGARGGALLEDQDFSTQMTLHWLDSEDDEDNKGPAQKAECLIVPQTPSPPRSQHAVCEPSSASDSDSLLRAVPGHAPSPVFPRDAVSLNARTPRASANPPSPLSSLIGPSKGVGGARGVRKKFTFRSMYAPTASEQGGACSSRGRGPRSGPSPQTQAAPPSAAQGAGTVLYYWGVPFCPRGRDPDEYTQVILAQLEVYEKSLKRAQRGLLHKAAWGEPVLPGVLRRPAPRRFRLKRPRPARPLRNQEDEEEEEEVEEEEDQGEAPAEEGEGEGSQTEQATVGGGGEGDGTQDSQALEVLSQTLLEEKSPLDLVPEKPQEKFTFLKRPSIRERSPAESETQLLEDQEEEEEDEGMCPETQLSEQDTQDVNMESPAGSQPRPECEVMEVMEVEEEEAGVEALSQPPAVAGEEACMEVEEEQPESTGGGPVEELQPGGGVECPLCMQRFPLQQIELHAEYCDGCSEPSAPGESCSQVMVLRKKNARRADGTEEDQPGSSRATKVPSQEKCFLCQGLFSVREYPSHVEACIQRKGSHTTQGGRGLLTALDQSEQQDSEAGPSHSSFRKKGHSRSSALADADQSGGGGDMNFSVSDSPIKAFTPISQAVDCLVDFKRQYSGRPSQRASRKRKHR